MENLSQLSALAILSAVFFMVLAVAQVMHTFLHVKAEHTRKFAHFAIGLTCVLAPFHFTNHWYLLISTVLFLGYLLYARKRHHLSALYEIGRGSVGDLLLPLAIYLNALLVLHYDFEPLFYLPLLVLTFADPAAYYGGHLFKKVKKSWQGSVFFATTAFLVSWLFLAVFATTTYQYQFLLITICATIGAIVEHVSTGGWDNLTVPLAIAGILTTYYAVMI